MIRHDMNVSPLVFAQIAKGRQTHFVRKSDEFRPSDPHNRQLPNPPEVGQAIDLREFRPCRDCGGSGRVRSNDGREMEDCCTRPYGEFTGRVISALVTHAEMVESFVAMSLRLVPTGEGGNESAKLLREIRDENDRLGIIRPMEPGPGRVFFYNPITGGVREV